MKCPFMEEEKYIRKQGEQIGYTLTVARACMKDECAIYDELNQCCGLKISPFINLLANITRK